MERVNTRKKSPKIVLSVIVCAILIAVLAGSYWFFTSKATQGSKAYTLEVVDDSGKSTKYTGHTDAEYLRQALDELQKKEKFSYEGTKGDYGLYINKVNGVTADYNTDGAYWSLYVNGEYGNYGIDEQPVKDEDAFKLAYEKAKADTKK